MAAQPAPAIAPPQPGTITPAETVLPNKRQRECHTIDWNDETRGVCGYRFKDAAGNSRPGHRHSRKSCIEAGHRHCQACLAMEELGLDGGRG